MKDYPLNCHISVYGDWTINTHDGQQIPLSGVLSYDPKQGVQLTGHCSGDIEELRKDRHFFIVTSQSNNLGGCTIFRAYISSASYLGTHCDVTITGASVVSNYIYDDNQKEYFNKAVLHYEHIDVFWDEPIVNLHSKKVEHGIYVAPEVKTLFATKFENCGLSLSEYVMVSGNHTYANAKIITKLSIESDSLLDYFTLISISHEANRALNFIRGNINDFVSVAFYKPFKTDDPLEKLSCKSFVIFNAFIPEKPPAFIPVVYFRERDDSASVIKALYSLYPKYRTSIISALSGIRNDDDAMYKFFALCRALESAYSHEKISSRDDDLNDMISKMLELIPENLDDSMKGLVRSRVSTIGEMSLKEKLEDIDEQLFQYTGIAVGLKSRHQYEGVASSITSLRNAVAHFGKKVTKTDSNEYHKHYLLLKRCFYAFLFMKAGVSPEYIRKNVLQYEFLAE